MKKAMMLLGVGLLLVAGWTAQATVINTWDGTNATYQSVGYSLSGVAVQWFTVPAGTVGTKFEFYCEKGTTTNPGYYAVVQIYNSQGYVDGNALSADQFNGSGDWIPVNNLSLAPGTYFAQMYSNNGTFNNMMHGLLFNPSTYADGYAAAGWSGGTALGDNQDFMARLTVVPEPATLSLIVLGGLSMVRRRK